MIISEDGLNMRGAEAGRGGESGGVERVQFLNMGHDFMSIFNL